MQCDRFLNVSEGGLCIWGGVGNILCSGFLVMGPSLDFPVRPFVLNGVYVAQLRLGMGGDAVSKRHTNCKKAREPKKGTELKKNEK